MIGFFLLPILLLLIIGLVIFLSLFGFLTNLIRRVTSVFRINRKASNVTSRSFSNNESKQKRFRKDEGEYIDYEELR